MQGRRWHDDFLARLQVAAGVAAETASSAMIKLLRHRKVERVMLVTPYPQWLLAPLREFVADNGIGVAGIVGLGLEPVDINGLGPEQCYRYAMDSDRPDADAIFILATNFRTLEVLSLLQADLGKPVMSSNQALMWTALRHLGLAPEPAQAQAPAAWPLDDA
jgi:maleate cis-trans isomerase